MKNGEKWFVGFCILIQFNRKIFHYKAHHQNLIKTLTFTTLFKKEIYMKTLDSNQEIAEKLEHSCPTKRISS